MITGIIMASGFSKRMEQEKLLLKVNGIPVIERVIKSILSSNVDNAILVCRKDVIKDIGVRYKIETVFNSEANKGQSQSIKLGVKASKSSTKGYMFFVGDQPFLNAETINTLIDKFNRSGHEIIVPFFNGKRGTPVIFSSVYKAHLLKLEGDMGGRKIIQDKWEKVGFVNIKDEHIGFDIDTAEEYNMVKKWS